MGRRFTVISSILLIGMAGMAGCGAAGISPPSQSNAMTVQAPSTVGTPNETSSFPPGTSASGMTDPARLLETHRSLFEDGAYEEQAYWEEFNRTPYINGEFVEFSVAPYSLTSERGPNATRVTLTQENSSTVYWITDEAVATNTTQYYNTTSHWYTYERNYPENVGDRYWWATNTTTIHLSPYLFEYNYTYTGTTTRNNQTLYEFRSTGRNETGSASGPDIGSSSPTWRTNVTLLIDQRGLIRSLNASQSVSTDNETVSVTDLQYSILPTDSATPRRPNWVTTELPHLEPSVAGNGTVIAVEHTGGASVSTAGLLVFLPNATVQSGFDGTFDSGETLYLYRTQNAPSEIQISQNEPPEVNESFVPLGGDQLSLTINRFKDETYDSGLAIQIDVSDPSANGT